MMILAVLASAAMLDALPAHHLKRKVRAPVRASLDRRSMRVRQERLRALKLAKFAIRHELLHNFLVETTTEAPAFTDAHVVDAGSGIEIGPSIADVDFLGSPIVRARAHNRSERELDVLLTVTLHDGRGGYARASAWIERLHPGESRTIELFSPSAMLPTSLEWAASSL